MRNVPICLSAGLLLLSSCDKKSVAFEDMTVTETRRITTADEKVKLFATSDERFRDTKPSPVLADLPDGWRTAAPTQFRNLNYRFGESGKGEAWVSLVGGSVLDNVNRWLGEFGQKPIDQAGLDSLEHADAAGGHGVWITAEGTYSGAMGAEPQSDFALAGAVVSLNGQILTVKMVGPKDEVASAKPQLKQLVASLRLAGTE
jgi:hypothetical protein